MPQPVVKSLRPFATLLNGTADVIRLLPVTGECPVVVSVGQELFVLLKGIVTAVKEVLAVLFHDNERYAVSLCFGWYQQQKGE